MSGQLQLPGSASSITAASVSPSLSNEALAVGEKIIQEIIDAAMPTLSTLAWAWFNKQHNSGFFGWAEHSLLGPIFTAIFGANPEVV